MGNEENKPNTDKAAPTECALLYAGHGTVTEYDDPDCCNKCGEKSNNKFDNCYDGVLHECSTECSACGFKDYWAHGFFQSGAEITGKARKYTSI